MALIKTTPQKVLDILRVLNAKPIKWFTIHDRFNESHTSELIIQCA